MASLATAALICMQCISTGKLTYPTLGVSRDTVMSNATNYAALFENKPQSLKARLGRITPRAGQGADLP